TLDTGGGAVYALAILADGRVVASGEFGLVASPALVPARLRNISSRMFVDSGDNALIAGVILAGSGEKKVLARAIGPSLTNAGITSPLQDPILELRNSNGALIASNDDWQQNPDKQAIIDSGLAPGDVRESALIATLPANGSTYTAIVRPARGSTGIGLVELYDLDPPENSARLANISSRGNVLGGDKAMISGFIISGSASMGPVKAVVRGIGPTIPLPGTLQDPTLELHDSSGMIAANDDWKTTQRSDIEATGLPPANDRESAILRWFPLGAHTAILRGKDNGAGIGLLELYDVTN
ncbi:MAG: large repetitive protein, partial [Verrucomicrobiota bacterium]